MIENKETSQLEKAEIIKKKFSLVLKKKREKLCSKTVCKNFIFEC